MCKHLCFRCGCVEDDTYDTVTITFIRNVHGSIHINSFSLKIQTVKSDGDSCVAFLTQSSK